MPRVSNCCGCCSLKIGIIIYGTLTLISRIYSMVNLISRLTDHDNSGASESSIASPKLTYSLLASIIVIMVILIIALIGVFEEKRFLIIPYMVVLVLEIILEIVFAIWCAASQLGIIAFILSLDICLQVYVLICIWSFYQDLNEQHSTRNSAEREVLY